MSPDLIFGVVSAVVAILSTIIAYVSLRNVRRQDISKASEERLAQVIRLSSEDIRGDVRELKHDVRRIDERGSQGLEKVVDRVGILETKVEVFWRSIATDAARILHSPHESRAELDTLLEAFEQQCMTREDVPRLLAKLDEIINVHVGTMVDGVPVTAGDQISAAIIIRYIERNEKAAI